MAEILTRADAFRVFLTGAASHAGAQTDPNLSLGNFQSSTLAPSFTWVRTNAISGIDIDAVSGENGAGAGTLIAFGVDDLKWTPPGGSQGTAVTILNGESKLVEGGGANGRNQFVRVTRTSASDLTGTETLTTTIAYNNVFGFDDVTSAEQAAGDDEYRAFCIRNVHATAEVKSVTVQVATLGTQRTTDTAQLPASGAGTIETTGSFADWPEVGYALIKDSGGTETEIIYYSSRTATVLTVPAVGRELFGGTEVAGSNDDTVDSIPGIAIGLDAPTSQPSGSFVDNTGVGEGTAPGGVSFSTPITDGDALTIGDLGTDEIYGVWIWRHVPAGSEARSGVVHDITIKADTA